MSDKIELIKAAIEKAELLESKLTEECFKIGGFTSPKIRHLMNNLGGISKKYLEVGVHRGSLFIATTYKNKIFMPQAVDNFSEFDDGTVKNEFIDNCNEFIGSGWDLIENDFFEVSPVRLHSFIDLYFYDGNHSYESQKKAITHVWPALENECIVVIDDMDWDNVRNGTLAGFDAMRSKHPEATIEMVTALSGPDWHNGIGIFLIKKSK